MNEAARLMDEIHHRVKRRDAEAAFVRAKNFEALHELYLSDDATVHVQNVAPQRRQLLGTTCTRPTAVG